MYVYTNTDLFVYTYVLLLILLHLQGVYFIHVTSDSLEEIYTKKLRA